MKQSNIIQKIETWKHLGFKTDSLGDALFGNPHTGMGFGWMAKVMAPVNTVLLQGFIDANPYIQQFPYSDQLRRTNGMNLFSDALFLFGVHVVTQRTAGIVWDIVSHNINDRELTKRFDALAIGGAEFEDQSVKYLERATGLILAVNAETGELMNEYPDFDTFLTKEIDRLVEAANIEGLLPYNFRLSF